MHLIKEIISHETPEQKRGQIRIISIYFKNTGENGLENQTRKPTFMNKPTATLYSKLFGMYNILYDRSHEKKPTLHSVAQPELVDF